MTTTRAKIFGAGAAIVAMTSATSAHALPDSTRRPFYVQGAVLGAAVWSDFRYGGAYHLDAEFGFHPSMRHDGFVIGIRQAFELSGESTGTTSVRAGYDIAIPFENGRFELTLAPFGTLGANYIFAATVQGGFHWSVGFEAKLFFFKGLYLLARPFEIGMGEFVNRQDKNENVYANFNASLGIGLAF